jgi:hypothetical protein
MRSRVRFPVLPWGFFLDGEGPHGDHGLGSLVEFRFKAPSRYFIFIYQITPHRDNVNRASLASQPRKPVTLRPQPGGETTKSIRDMWWHWIYIYVCVCVCVPKFANFFNETNHNFCKHNVKQNFQTPKSSHTFAVVTSGQESPHTAGGPTVY